MDMNEGKVGEKLGRALDNARLVKYDEWNGTLVVWNGSVTFHAYDIETGDCVAMWTGEHQLGLDDAKWWDGNWRLQAASAEIERVTSDKAAKYNDGESYLEVYRV